MGRRGGTNRLDVLQGQRSVVLQAALDYTKAYREDPAASDEERNHLFREVDALRRCYAQQGGGRL